MHSVKKSWQAYKESLKYLARGSSTGSKVPEYEETEPAQIIRGKGCRVWDMDGNEYIDFRNALGPITLGYGVPEIDEAISRQLQNGIIFGHPHPLEGEVARLLVENIPCAERVRFLKTGGEAIAACIKLARAATGREKIIQCDYNGWLNTIAGGGYRPPGIAISQPFKGVPRCLQELHNELPWNDLEKWKEVFANEGAEIAAVVVASHLSKIEDGRDFLLALRELTRKHGALMIMDEIVTGFRVALGGVHEYFRVQPDLAVFAKGIANGMPLAAYLGRADLLDSVREIGISSTYGGETLSLAAAKAAIGFYRKNDVIGHLWQMGKMMTDGLNRLFTEHGIPARLSGLPPCSCFIFEDQVMAKKFFRNCYAEDVSLYNCLYINYSHQETDIAEALDRVARAVRKMV